MVGINHVLGFIFYKKGKMYICPNPSGLHVLLSENTSNTQTLLFGTKLLVFCCDSHGQVSSLNSTAKPQA